MSDSWITSEFIRICDDSVGDESSFAGFGAVPEKKTGSALGLAWVVHKPG
jgi:hypothetical protein